jgi:UV DNA damage endonuclease
MPHQVGYCCINLTLGKEKISTGRTLRQASFKQDTKLERTSLLALQNATDLVKILKWNEENNVKVFRIGSNIFPWNSEYEVTQLPDYSTIVEYLHLAGQIIQQSGQRVSFHPDHFVKLGTVKDVVVRRSIHDLNHHDWILNMMGLPATHYYPLNIHVGMNRSEETTQRFIERFEMLNESTKARLVVENDDKANAYSVLNLFNDLYLNIKTPITFDYFHHTFHSSDLTSEEAAKMAAETWDCKPLFHYSESKNLNENVSGNPRAHSDYALLTLDDYRLNIDVDLETKAKELAWTLYERKRHDKMVS